MSEAEKIAAGLTKAFLQDPYGEGHIGHARCPYGIHHAYREPWLDGYMAAVRAHLERNPDNG